MITRNGNRVLVSGDLTMATASRVFGAGLQSAGSSPLVIDMAQVQVVDSAAVSLMLSWLREAQRNNIQVCFVHVPDNLLSLAKLYSVAESLPLCPAE